MVYIYITIMYSWHVSNYSHYELIKKKH